MRLAIISAILTLSSCAPKQERFPEYFPSPGDSLASYIPDPQLKEEKAGTDLTSFFASRNLYAMKEPIISYGKVDRRVYRFLWMRTFHRPVVITINRTDSAIWLHTKVANTHPEMYNYSARIDVDDTASSDWQGYTFTYYEHRGWYATRPANRNVKLDYSKQRKLTEEQWNKFMSLVEQIGYWEYPFYESADHTDGASWALEAADNGHYHFSTTRMIETPLKIPCMYLLQLSGLKERVY